MHLDQFDATDLEWAPQSSGDYFGHLQYRQTTTEKEGVEANNRLPTY